MRVVLSKATNASEAMQYTALLKTIDRSPFRKTHRQFSIGSLRVFEDIHMERTVHRLQVVKLLIDLDRGVHVLSVEAQMSACFPKRGTSDVRRVDKVVS